MSERRPGLGRSKELGLGVGLLGFALVLAVFFGALERERHPKSAGADAAALLDGASQDRLDGAAQRDGAEAPFAGSADAARGAGEP